MIPDRLERSLRPSGNSERLTVGDEDIVHHVTVYIPPSSQPIFIA